MSVFISPPSSSSVITTNLAQDVFSLEGDTVALLLDYTQDVVVTQIVLYSPTDTDATANTFSIGTNAPDYDNVVPTFKIDSWAATATYNLPVGPNGVTVTADLYINFGTDIGDVSTLSYVINGYFA